MERCKEKTKRALGKVHPVHHFPRTHPPCFLPCPAQIGDVDTDHNTWWGRPEQQAQGGAQGSPGWRPVHVINSAGGKGADIVGEVGVAAVLLACGRGKGYRIKAMSQMASPTFFMTPKSAHCNDASFILRHVLAAGRAAGMMPFI